MGKGNLTTAAGWVIRGERFSSPLLVAGIINVTPDSFSDGGKFFKIDDALALLQRHLVEGADLLDLGAESTRPGSRPVDSSEEVERLRPILEATLFVRQGRPDFTVCVDTYRADTALFALECGVEVINDISGGLFEPPILELVAHYKAGYVLGHCPEPPQTMQKAPYYKDVIETLLRHFSNTMERLLRLGLPEESIVLDPCIGFGKNLEHNKRIIKEVPRLLSLGRPLYFGISRKRFLGELTGLPVDQRDGATQVLTALLAEKGVCIHRVHNVGLAKMALRLQAACGDSPYCEEV